MGIPGAGLDRNPRGRRTRGGATCHGDPRSRARRGNPRGRRTGRCHDHPRGQGSTGDPERQAPGRAAVSLQSRAQRRTPGAGPHRPPLHIRRPLPGGDFAGKCSGANFDADKTVFWPESDQKKPPVGQPLQTKLAGWSRSAGWFWPWAARPAVVGWPAKVSRPTLAGVTGVVSVRSAG